MNIKLLFFIFLSTSICESAFAKETAYSCSTLTKQIHDNRTRDNTSLNKRRDECRSLGFSTMKSSKMNSFDNAYSSGNGSASYGGSESKHSCSTLSDEIFKTTNKSKKSELYKRKKRCVKLGYSTTSKRIN